MAHEGLATGKQAIDPFPGTWRIANVGQGQWHLGAFGDPDIQGGATPAVGVLGNRLTQSSANLVISHRRTQGSRHP